MRGDPVVVTITEVDRGRLHDATRDLTGVKRCLFDIADRSGSRALTELYSRAHALHCDLQRFLTPGQVEEEPHADGHADLQPELMTPAEVATFFRVDPATVRGWARDGKLAPVWTPGGTAATGRRTSARWSTERRVPDDRP